MKPKLNMLSAAVMAMTVFWLGCSGARPLHRSETSIRSSLLKRTPPGTPCDKVEAYVTKHWRMKFVLAGPPPGDWLGKAGAAGNPANGDVRVTLHVRLGGYYVFPLFEKDVVGFWLFDTNRQLSDVWVGKTITGL